MVGSRVRCFDCFEEIEVNAYAVLKKMRDWPDDAKPNEPLDSLLFDQVLVCSDCGRWYGDNAVLVSVEP